MNEEQPSIAEAFLTALENRDLVASIVPKKQGMMLALTCKRVHAALKKLNKLKHPLRFSPSVASGQVLEFLQSLSMEGASKPWWYACVNSMRLTNMQFERSPEVSSPTERFEIIVVQGLRVFAPLANLCLRLPETVGPMLPRVRLPESVGPMLPPAAIARILEVGTSLKSLDLAKTAYRKPERNEGDFEQLYTALGQCTNLKKLNLAGAISIVNCAEFFGVVGKLGNLQQLNIKSTKVFRSSATTTALIEALGKLTGLQSLNLSNASGCYTGDQPVEGLRSCQSGFFSALAALDLVSLNIGSNPMQTLDRHLGNALRKNTRLQELNIDETALVKPYQVIDGLTSLTSLQWESGRYSRPLPFRDQMIEVRQGLPNLKDIAY